MPCMLLPDRRTQPKGDCRKGHEQREADHIDRDEWHQSPEYPDDRNFRQDRLQNKNVHADRGRHKSNLGGLLH